MSTRTLCFETHHEVDAHFSEAYDSMDSDDGTGYAAVRQSQEVGERRFSREHETKSRSFTVPRPTSSYKRVVATLSDSDDHQSDWSYSRYQWDQEEVTSLGQTMWVSMVASS